MRVVDKEEKGLITQCRSFSSVARALGDLLKKKKRRLAFSARGKESNEEAPIGMEEASRLNTWGSDARIKKESTFYCPLRKRERLSR